jgi:Flp pilus assembly protein CpaB
VGKSKQQGRIHAGRSAGGERKEMSKLSPGTLILGIFAVLFGLVGAYAVKRHLQEDPPPEVVVEAELPKTIPLASIDLEQGRTLNSGDVMLVPMNREDRIELGLPRMYMGNPSQIVGRILREPVEKGRPFVPTMFYPEGYGPDVSERLEPGYRAVTISVKDNLREFGLVSPGMFVDVMFRTDANPEEYIPETTVTLLEHVEVLAIDHEVFQGARANGPRSGGNGNVATVTVAVTPNQASAIKVVEGHGTMSLAVRGAEDGQLLAAAEPQTLTGLLDLPEPEPPFTTEIYRRGRLTTAVFQDGQRTSLVAEAFDELPVAAERGPGRVMTISQRLAKSEDTDEKAPCGCGE